MIKHPKFHGVYKLNEYNKKWFAAVRYKNLHKQLGMFDTDQRAAIGYDAMVIRLHLEDVLPMNYPPDPQLSLLQIFCLNAGLGIPVSNQATGIAQVGIAQAIIKFPMNPKLLSMTIYKLIRLFAVKKMEAPACLKMVAGVGRGNSNINDFQRKQLIDVKLEERSGAVSFNWGTAFY